MVTGLPLKIVVQKLLTSGYYLKNGPTLELTRNTAVITTFFESITGYYCPVIHEKPLARGRLGGNCSKFWKITRKLSMTS